MSHLSILPTVFTRLDWLEQSLLDEGFTVDRGAPLPVFGKDPQVVDLIARVDASPPLAWVRRGDGAIEMVGDLQRISLHTGLSSRLQRVSRRYALLEAMDQIECLDPAVAQVSLIAA